MQRDSRRKRSATSSEGSSSCVIAPFVNEVKVASPFTSERAWTSRRRLAPIAQKCAMQVCKRRRPTTSKSLPPRLPPMFGAVHARPLRSPAMPTFSACFRRCHPRRKAVVGASGNCPAPKCDTVFVGAFARGELCFGGAARSPQQGFRQEHRGGCRQRRRNFCRQGGSKG